MHLTQFKNNNCNVRNLHVYCTILYRLYTHGYLLFMFKYDISKMLSYYNIIIYVLEKYSSLQASSQVM